MKTNLSFLSIMAGLLAIASTAGAQTYAVASPTLAGYGGYGGYGYYGYGHHASTLEEGVLQGYAALAQAQGQASYFDSLAAINAQEAYSRYLANREKATETYFRARQIYRAVHDAERPHRLSLTQYAELAKKLAPAGLADSQYNRAIGRFNWPAVLGTEEFAMERALVNDAFRNRSPGDAGPASGFYADIKDVADSMLQKLRRHASELNPAQYMAARKFIDGLTVEAQQPAASEALAMK